MGTSIGLDPLASRAAVGDSIPRYQRQALILAESRGLLDLNVCPPMSM